MAQLGEVKRSLAPLIYQLAPPSTSCAFAFLYIYQVFVWFKIIYNYAFYRRFPRKISATDFFTKKIRLFFRRVYYRFQSVLIVIKYFIEPPPPKRRLWLHDTAYFFMRNRGIFRNIFRWWWEGYDEYENIITAEIVLCFKTVNKKNWEVTGWHPPPRMHGPDALHFW